jgi:hypothetical protein
MPTELNLSDLANNGHKPHGGFKKEMSDFLKSK